VIERQCKPVDVSDEQSEDGERENYRVGGAKRDVNDNEEQPL